MDFYMEYRWKYIKGEKKNPFEYMLPEMLFFPSNLFTIVKDRSITNWFKSS
jgi:hypothetical protein